MTYKKLLKLSLTVIMTLAMITTSTLVAIAGSDTEIGVLTVGDSKEDVSVPRNATVTFVVSWDNSIKSSIGMPYTVLNGRGEHVAFEYTSDANKCEVIDGRLHFYVKCTRDEDYTVTATAYTSQDKTTRRELGKTNAIHLKVGDGADSRDINNVNVGCSLGEFGVLALACVVLGLKLCK